MLVTHHSIMVGDLESHAKTIKRCFDKRQPHMQCFLYFFFPCKQKQKTPQRAYSTCCSKKIGYVVSYEI